MTSMRRKAFTLVELLVVVAVIAILISLLLPAINRFRVQAQSTECLTNQRNLIAAYTQYSIDKNGRVPGTDTGAYAYDWMQTVGGQHNPPGGCCNGFQNGVVNWDQGGDDANPNADCNTDSESALPRDRYPLYAAGFLHRSGGRQQ